MNTQLKFANISNHPFSRWEKEQLAAATAMVNNGELLEFPFPAVPATVTAKEICCMAKAIAADVIGMGCTHAMVQGQMNLTFKLVEELKSVGVQCYAAVSDRNTKENRDGTKTVSFDFVQFLEY